MSLGPIVLLNALSIWLSALTEFVFNICRFLYDDAVDDKIRHQHPASELEALIVTETCFRHPLPILFCFAGFIWR